MPFQQVIRMALSRYEWCGMSLPANRLTFQPCNFKPRIYVYEMQCDCGLEEVQFIEEGLANETTREMENTIRNVNDGLVNGVVGLALFGDLDLQYH